MTGDRPPGRLPLHLVTQDLGAPPGYARAIQHGTPARSAQRADRAADAELARQAVLLRRWEQTVPPKLAAARLEHLEGVVGADAVIRWARGTDGDLGLEPAPWRQGRNLLLLGATGVGKSYAAVAAAREVVRAGTGCLYWSVPELLAAVHWETPDHEATLRRAQMVPVLILDDLGSEGPNDWTQRTLYRLIEARDRDRRATIGTTNLEPADLADALGDRSYSRLAGGSIAVRFAGDDRRRTAP